MLRRFSLVALVLFVAAVAAIQLVQSSPGVYRWLEEVSAPLARRVGGPPREAPHGGTVATPAAPSPAPTGGPAPSVQEPAGALPGAPAPAGEPATPPAAAAAPSDPRVAFESAEANPRRAHRPAAELAAPRDVEPPPSPSDLFAEADGPNVRLSWPAADDGAGVDRYEVLRDGEVLVSTPSTSLVDEAAPPMKRLCYAIVARDAAGNRSRPSRAVCVTLADIVPPTPPTAVQARPTSEASVALFWSGATDAGGIVSYDVVRAGAVVATSDSPRSADSGLLAGRTYCWTVRARDAAGNVSKDSPEACATIRDQLPPAPPTGLVTAPASADRVAFAWQPSTDNVGVDHYDVLRDGRLVARTGAAKVSGLEAGLAPSTSYCYTVVAVDAAGNRSRPSAATCARTAEAGTPSGPTELALAPSPRSSSALVLRWDASPDPGVVYSVYWDANKRIGATPRTEYTVVGLKVGERRCFRVTAVDPSGKESPSSIEACSTAPKR